MLKYEPSTLLTLKGLCSCFFSFEAYLCYRRDDGDEGRREESSSSTCPAACGWFRLLRAGLRNAQFMGDDVLVLLALKRSW
jgi:hypothetical protein